MLEGNLTLTIQKVLNLKSKDSKKLTKNWQQALRVLKINLDYRMTLKKRIQDITKKKLPNLNCNLNLPMPE
jgi:hypothetical protein